MIEFRIVDAPHQYPGVCIDHSSDGPCVDTHYELGECHLYLNARTIREAACTGILRPVDVDAIAARYGLPTADQHSELEQSNSNQAAKIVELETRIAELAPVEGAIARAIARYGDVELDDEPVRPTVRRPRQKAA